MMQAAHCCLNCQNRCLQSQIPLFPIPKDNILERNGFSHSVEPGRVSGEEFLWHSPEKRRPGLQHRRGFFVFRFGTCRFSLAWMLDQCWRHSPSLLNVTSGCVWKVFEASQTRSFPLSTGWGVKIKNRSTADTKIHLYLNQFFGNVGENTSWRSKSHDMHKPEINRMSQSPRSL